MEYDSLIAQWKVNRISIVVNGRGLVGFALEQLYQIGSFLMNISDDTICCRSFLCGTEGNSACTCALWQYEKKEKKIVLAKTVVETCRTPDPPKTTRRCVCVCVCVFECVWSSVATVIKSGSFCALRDVSSLVSERNVPPLHHSTKPPPLPLLSPVFSSGQFPMEGIIVKFT